MIYELINPSDTITFKAPDLKTAALATFILSEAKYGAKACFDEGGEDVPMFLFGGAEKWFEEKFNQTFTEAINEPMGKVADCLDSFAYTDPEGYAALSEKMTAIQDPEELEAFRTQHDNERRTSMARIVRKAWVLAKYIRANEDPTNAEKCGDTVPG